MKVTMNKTIHNISGEEFKKGEKVEVIDCWFNKISDDITISVRNQEGKCLIAWIKYFGMK